MSDNQTAAPRFGINTMAQTPRQCHWCGNMHGPRCPHVAAMEFHPNGEIKRVEFVQPQAIPMDLSKLKIGGVP